LAIIEIKRPIGAEATEVEIVMEQALEIVLWRRDEWRRNASKRLVHALALLQSMPLDSFSGAERTVEGGIWVAHLKNR
jgi:hypothetical protein